MKTISSFSSKLLALTLALMASVASFAYEFEYVNDFHIDGFAYSINSTSANNDSEEGYVGLIEIADCQKDVLVPKYVSYGDRGFHVTKFGMGSVVFTNEAGSVVESVTIPNTTYVINKNVLAGCPNLKTVVVDSDNPYYDSRENCNAIITTSQNPYFTPNTLIAGCKTTIIPNSVVEIGANAFYNCQSLETITIPNSVTKIGRSAFNACSALSSITLSENLTAIGEWAFDDCNNLIEVVCYATQPPTISQYTFSGISPTIYVPAESIEQYRAADGWKDLQIQYISWSEGCEEYKHINLAVQMLPKISSMIFDISNNGTIEPPYVDSVWILKTEQEPLRKLDAQSGDTIDLSFLEENEDYILRVYINGCIKSRTFWHRVIPNNWPDTWCDTWNVMWFDGWFFDETASTSKYRLGKDTIIGDYTYSKFNARTYVRFTEDWKVYVYYEGFDDNDPYTQDLPTGEYLAYDFSAQVGDTLEVFSGVHSYSKYKCLVREVQTDPETKLRTITLFQLLLEDTDGDGVEEEYGRGEMTWIEGVGSPNGFLINTPPPGGGTFALLCAHKGDELKYTGPLYEEYGCEYNAGPFNEKLLGTWRVVSGNEIISISDSIIVFKYLGLTQKYTASATQLTVERLWIPEEESYRWANCNYTLSNDTLWIDNFVPLLVATYPPTFGPITLVKVKHEDLFPTLWGLQRTVCNEYCGETEDDNSANFTYKQTFDSIFFENDKPYILCNDYLLREEDNKIFLYSQSLNKDIVLYDFTLEVGDSLPAYIKDFDGTMYSDDTLVVTGISNVTLLDGKEYKKWTFDNGMEYVEGIGMYGGHRNGNFFGLIQEIVVPCHTGTHLVCVSKNGKLLYQMDDAEMERLGTECLCAGYLSSYKSQWCNQWNILAHGYLGPQDPLVAARTSIFWLSNNTVNRDGQEYIPLMCSSSMPNEESTLLVGELRFTEDKQVYFYYAFDETEYLLYDFGAELGDTLELFAGLEFYDYHKTYTHVITNKETLDDGRLQIQADVVIRIDNGAGEYFEEKHPVTWIEGLGSTYGIIFNPSNPGVAGDGAIIMLCAYRDDECVYKTDSNDPYWIDYTQLGCVYNEGDFIDGAFPMLSGLQRTVCNEYCGETEDDNSANSTYKQTFDSIFFENDKPYILCNDYLLREEDNKILIYSQLLNKDLVLYDFTLEVGDSLPALYIDWQYHNAMDWIPYNLDVVDYNKDYDGTIYPADTFVVTDISNVTLLDGKEYKKWTFDNGMEYVEGIGMYGGRRNGNFFGLIQEVVVPCHIGTHLVCVSKNGKLLYQMDDTEMERLGTECLCDYDSGHRKDNAKDGQIGGRPTPTQWNQLEVVLREMDNNHTILQAETFSYTLEDISQQVNNKTYFQLARQSTKDTATTKSVVGALHFGKDEDNRVYFLRDGVEYVLYDFTAEPGDTVEIFAGINNYPQETTYTHVVTGKDTLENDACRMLLEVVFPDETNTTAENAEKVWLAGLGSVDGIVHNAAKRASNAHAAPSRTAHSNDTQTSVMLCAWREDSCLYTTDHPDYDSFGCVYNQDPTSVENTHSPSPTTDYKKLLRNGQLLIIHNGKTYNVLGVAVE